MPRRSILFAALAGATMALATLPNGLTPLAFASAPLLLIAMESLPPGVRRTPRGAALGLVSGLVYDVAILHWAPDAIAAYGEHPLGLAWVIGALLFIVSALPFVLAAAMSSLVDPRSERGWWVLPVALGVAFSVSPMLFPWSPAEVVTPWLAYVQVAELGGRSLVVMLVSLAGCALVEGLRRRRRGRPALLVALLALLLPPAYGLLRMEAVERERLEAPILRVGLVQPDIDLGTGRDPERRASRLERLREQTALLEAEGAELVIWPESSYPYPIARGRRRDIGGRLGVRDGRLRRPLLFGAITREGRCREWNTIVVMDAEGEFELVDKVALMPFAETVPFGSLLPALRERHPCPGHMRGDEPKVVELAGARIGLLNCYEDVTARWAAELTGRAPDLLANTSNDAWFGRGLFPHLHHGVARLRAIESRRDMVRSVNAGISAHVDANGIERWRSADDEVEHAVVEARLLEGRTLYHRAGDWPSWMGAILLLGLALSERGRGS